VIFEQADAEAKEFFDEHGYLVLGPRFSREECATLQATFDRMLERFAQEQGLPIGEYTRVISQWRDLWHMNERFRNTLQDARLWQTAATLMGRRGARLLHDHVIAKPARASNTVPWHQDYPYWPVDTAEGLSCWCPLEDVGPEGGCLEVIDGSHRWGESPPVDFIADDHSALNARADLVRLPVSAGSMVVLNSLTWHRTGPNTDAGRRRVYITLWLPPDARYSPTHSGWHPVNEHVKVAPGEILNDDWFPCMGEREIRHQEAQPLSHHGPDVSRTGLSMFNATQRIGAQIRSILERAGYPAEGRGLAVLLADDAACQRLLTSSLEAGVLRSTQADDFLQVLTLLRHSSDAYRLHRARNVYNEAYIAWWTLVGARWDERLGVAPVSGSTH
jgi:ectoine hydroxylase-related dioxygenase (phytanoyl-CoA dioxygenase family)